MRHSFISRKCFVISIALVWCACGAPAEVPPNIILIVPDALRAKQLPVYGYSKIATPRLDDLAKDSIVFQHCYVKTPGTVDSFSNLFSGSWLASNGLIKGEKTLAQYLQEVNYQTAGFVSSRILWAAEHFEKGHERNEFDRGFDKYVQDVSLEQWPYHRSNAATTEDVLKWLKTKRNPGRPFFLFVHYMDPHAPYEPSYDGEVEKIDYELGRIVETLQSLSLYDDSLIVFTSDHGESLEEHSAPRGHGWFSYTEQTRVPLLMKFPRQRHRGEVRQLVRNIDIMPTILDTVGIRHRGGKRDGVSLFPTIRSDESLNLVSYHQVNANRVLPEGAESVVFQLGGTQYHYIEGTFGDRYRELYDLLKDPNESKNLYKAEGYEAARQEGESQLREMRADLNKEREDALPDSSQLDPEQLRTMESLGYIAGGAPGPALYRGPFAMNQDLNSRESIEYVDFIRHPTWGIRLNDEFYPSRVVAADSGTVFVIADETGVLYRYAQPERRFHKLLEGALDMALGPGGALWVLRGDGEIVVLESSLHNAEARPFTRAVGARAIEVDADGNVYLLSGKHLVRLDGTGSQADSVDLVDVPQELAVAPDGHVYVALKRRVLRVARDRSLEPFIAADVLRAIVASIAVDNQHRLWVLEASRPRARVFDREASVVGSIQYNSEGIETRDIFIDGDRIYAIDEWEGILVYSMKSEKEARSNP